MNAADFFTVFWSPELDHGKALCWGGGRNAAALQQISREIERQIPEQGEDSTSLTFALSGTGLKIAEYIRNTIPDCNWSPFRSIRR